MTIDVKCDKIIRVVGYYAKVESINDGKKQEFQDRKYMEE